MPAASSSNTGGRSCIRICSRPARASEHRAGSEAPLLRMTNRLIGSWTLVSYHSIDPDGSIGKPYGEAVGRLTYDELGNMSGQVMRPGRKPVTHSAESTSNIRRPAPSSTGI